MRNEQKLNFFLGALVLLLTGCTNAKTLSDLQSKIGTFAFSTSATSLPDAYKGQKYTYNFAVTNAVAPITYTIASGSVPGGLSLSTTTGVMTGAVTGNVGAYHFTVKATDSTGSSVSLTYDLNVSVPFGLATTSLPSAVINTSYLSVISVTGGVPPYTYAATGLPTGLALNASIGLISGTATSLGTSTVNLTVTDAIGQIANSSLSLAVTVSGGAPAISTTTLANGVLGSNYAAAIAMSGGVAPITYSISSGSLPAGLTLDTASGIISGIPTATGTSSFSVTVTDSSAQTASKALTLTISASAAPTMAGGSLANGQVAVPYADVVIASGGSTPYTFTITAGTLPAGLTLSASTGKIAGTPSATGTSLFTVKATDSLGSYSTANYSILINSSPYATLAFQNTTLLPMSVGINDTRAAIVGGGLPPYTLAITVGSLPSGLSLDTSTGIISGIPSATGTSNFTLQVTDSRGTTASRAYSLLISAPLKITTTSLNVAITNQAYISNIAVSGGTAPYTYGAAGLPSGLTMGAGGAISGLVTVTSSNTVTITVTDANGLSVSSAYTLTAADPVSISTATVAKAAIQRSYSQTIVAANGIAPYAFTVSSGALPSGLTLSSAGVISGSPTKGANAKTGSFTFTVQVTDSMGQTATRSYTMPVTIAPDIVSDVNYQLTTAVVGGAYNYPLKVWGGFGTLTYSASGLPTGLSVNASSGFLSGTPGAGTAGTYSVNFTVTDSNGQSQTKAKTLRVVSAGKTAKFDGSISNSYTGGRAGLYETQSADVNNDGFLDVISTSFTSKEMIIALGNGTGTFTTYFATVTHNPIGFSIADMDGDSKLDLVVVENNSGYAVEIIKGDNVWTTPASLTRQSITSGLNVPDQLALGDLNGDGRLDIVVNNYSGASVSVFLNCGTGGTTVNYNGNATQACSNTAQTITNYHVAATVTNSISNPWGVGLTDLNGDNKLDLVVTNYAQQKVLTFLGNNNGTFAAAPTYTSTAYAYTLDRIRTMTEPPNGYNNAYYAAGSSFIDMNGDGKRDIVIAGNNVAYILIGDGAGAFIQSYTADMSDLYTPMSIHVKVADINGDSKPDVVLANNNILRYNIGVFYNTGSGLVNNRKLISEGAYGNVTIANILTSGTRPALVNVRTYNTGYPVNITVRPNNNLASAYDAGTFYPAYTSPSGYVQDTSIGSLAAGDINNDGYLDLMGKINGYGSIFIGSSTGAFTNRTDQFPTGEASTFNYWNSTSSALVDVNGDGNLDYFSANANGSMYSTVGYLLGAGDGTFGTLNTISVDGSGCTNTLGANAVSFADYNKDGKLDVAVGAGCSGIARIIVFNGYGDGTFNLASPTIITISNSNYIDALQSYDVNADGHMDLVVASRNGYLMIYLNDGTGAFTLKTSLVLGIGASMSALKIADLNRDGQPDYVIAGMNSGNIAIISGGANGTISSTTTSTGISTGLVAGYIVTGVELTDWDSDGKIDILMSKAYSGIQFLRGNGDGTFINPTAPILLPNPSISSSCIPNASDLNGDGMPDLLIYNGDTNGASGIGTSFNLSQ